MLYDAMSCIVLFGVVLYCAVTLLMMRMPQSAIKLNHLPWHDDLVGDRHREYHTQAAIKFKHLSEADDLKGDRHN